MKMKQISDRVYEFFNPEFEDSIFNTVETQDFEELFDSELDSQDEVIEEFSMTTEEFFDIMSNALNQLSVGEAESIGLF